MQTNNPGVRQQGVKLHIRVLYGLLNKGVIFLVAILKIFLCIQSQLCAKRTKIIQTTCEHPGGYQVVNETLLSDFFESTLKRLEHILFGAAVFHIKLLGF